MGDRQELGASNDLESNAMIDAVRQVEMVRHAGFAPGQFPARWHDAAYRLHCRAWPSVWEGRLSRDRFIAELEADHIDTLYEANGNGNDAPLLAYIYPGAHRFHADAVPAMVQFFQDQSKASDMRSFGSRGGE